MRPLHIDIAIENGSWPSKIELHQLLTSTIDATACEASLIWPENAELSVVFTDDYQISKINEKWRNKPNPTNVLSFPGGDIAVGDPADLMIGDLIFAFETVNRERVEQNKTFCQHLMHLMSHGFLHLFGYDHINGEDAELMENLEIKALARLGIENPYA